jgi:hypothetical protein
MNNHDCKRKSAAVFEPRRYIINSLLLKYGDAV